MAAKTIAAARGRGGGTRRARPAKEARADLSTAPLEDIHLIPLEVVETLDQEVENRASQRDRDWFAARPRRSFRLRLRLQGELGAPHRDRQFVIVRQVVPGARVRIPFAALGSPPPDNDLALARVVEIIASGGSAHWSGGRVFTFDELPVAGLAQ